MSNISKKIAELSPEKLELLLKLRHKKQENSQKKEIIPQSRETGLFPLSFAQQRLWFLDQLMPDNPFYNIPFALRLVGQLDVLALERSFNEIIRRHETLRTCFESIDAKPMQRIASSLELTLTTIDLQDLPQEKREDEVRKLATIEASQPFGLNQLPLLRVKLLCLAPTEHVVLLVMHHIISDGWSMGVFTHELAVLYEAFVTGKPTHLPELSIQYADFSVWQRQWLQQAQTEQLQYWRKQLTDITVLQLPTDYPRSAVQSFAGAIKIIELPQNLKQALVQLSQQHDVTIFMTMLAAFKILLHRYTGQTDIVVGSPIANRNRSEIEPLIGFFVNSLVMRTDLDGNPSFSDLLTRVRKVALDAYAHQDLPFEKLVEELQPERNLSQNPLFQVTFAVQNVPIQDLQLKGLQLSPLEFEYNMTRLDLEWHIWEHSQGLRVMVAYATDLFAPESIDRMTGHFVTLLEGIVANPKERILQLPLLTSLEQRQLLVEWNNTKADYSFDKCIHHLFEEQVQLTPDAVAVVFENQQLTYQQLNCRANQLAHHLRSLGVGADVLVGLCVERSLLTAIGLLGILKAGGAYVPLDPEYPIDRLSFMLEDTKVQVLLTQEHLVKKLPQHQAKLVFLDEIWAIFAQNNQDNSIVGVTASNLANVIYTSGSTGKPKGVMVEHRGLCNLAQAQIQTFGLHCDSRVLQFASLSFDVSILEILMALGSGATLYLGAKDSLLPGKPLIEQLRNHCITHITLPPSALAVMPVEELPALQTIIVAGEACGSELVLKWATGRRFFNAYGPTEASVYATVAECTDTINKPSIGRPISNTQVYLLSEQLEPVPVGVPGELYIGGVGLARGYLNRPELTAERFISNPFSDLLGERLYKTGDLARYLPDGNIEYLERIDHQVKVRGFRIELGEIEALLSQHSDVQASVVIAREDNPGDKRLVAYIVPQHQATPTNSELRRFLKQKLPEYMIPNAFVILESLPLTPNGKVDRRALPVLDLEINCSVSFVPPRDIIELQLTQIWSEVLKIDSIGLQDNFFEVGGHSLLAMRLMAKIQQQFGKNLPLATLFQAPTVEQLAAIVRENLDSSVWSSLVAIQPGDSKQPFFCVPGAGGNVVYLYDLAHYLGQDQPFYGLQAPGLDGGELYTRIEDIALHYIKEIQTVQPQGPYLLGGHSFGGQVAFEMAIQLQKQGHEVALLAIFDTTAPIINHSKPITDDWDNTQWLTQFSKASELLFKKNLKVSYADLQPLEPDEQLNYLLKQFEIAKALPLGTDIRQFRNWVEVFKANCQVDYISHEVYPNRITLFRASEMISDKTISEMTFDIAEDSAWGWDKLSAQAVDIHFVPGDHITMMAKPHVQVLAELLTKAATVKE